MSQKFLKKFRALKLNFLIFKRGQFRFRFSDFQFFLLTWIKMVLPRTSSFFISRKYFHHPRYSYNKENRATPEYLSSTVLSPLCLHLSCTQRAGLLSAFRVPAWKVFVRFQRVIFTSNPPQGYYTARNHTPTRPSCEIPMQLRICNVQRCTGAHTPNPVPGAQVILYF